jgi:hypothetical protein
MMNSILKGTGIFVALSLCCMLSILLYLFPYHPDKFYEWGFLFLASLPITIAFEAAGYALFEKKFTSRNASGLRILYGVFVLGILLVLGAVLYRSVHFHLVKWNF